MLPAATGGDTVAARFLTLTFPYYYEVSGLPPGLRFNADDADDLGHADDAGQLHGDLLRGRRRREEREPESRCFGLDGHGNADVRHRGDERRAGDPVGGDRVDAVAGYGVDDGTADTYGLGET